jgi:uncharacterized membrane protein YccC
MTAMAESNQDQAGLRTWWTSEVQGLGWKHAIKVAVAAALCYEITRRLGSGQGWWAAITSIVVLQSDVGTTLRTCRDRLIGTAMGALLGWPVSIFWHGNVLIYALAVVFLIIFCNLIGLSNAGRLGAVALTVIVLVHFEVSPGRAALSRFLEVALGVVVALIVQWTIFPSEGRKRPEPAT